MSDLIGAWLELPIPAIFGTLVAFYGGAAAFIVWLTFRSRAGRHVKSINGVVAPFFVSTALLFGLMAGFLSSDVWDRNKQAERAVLAESDTLVALYSLGAASGGDDRDLRSAIRTYVQAVVDDEWLHL